MKVTDGITNIVLLVKPPATGLGLLRALGLRCRWRVCRVIKISMIYLHGGLKIFNTLMAVCSLENKTLSGWEQTKAADRRQGGSWDVASQERRWSKEKGNGRRSEEKGVILRRTWQINQLSITSSEGKLSSGSQLNLIWEQPPGDGSISFSSMPQRSRELHTKRTNKAAFPASPASWFKTPTLLKAALPPLFFRCVWLNQYHFYRHWSLLWTLGESAA